MHFWGGLRCCLGLTSQVCLLFGSAGFFGMPSAVPPRAVVFLRGRVGGICRGPGECARWVILQGLGVWKGLCCLVLFSTCLGGLGVLDMPTALPARAVVCFQGRVWGMCKGTGGYDRWLSVPASLVFEGLDGLVGPVKSAGLGTGAWCVSVWDSVFALMSGVSDVRTFCL